MSTTRFKLKNPALQELKLVWPQTSLSRVLHPTAADSSWCGVTFIASLLSDTPGFDLHRADQLPSIHPSSFTGSLQETMSLHVEWNKRCGLYHSSAQVKYELFAVLHLTHRNLSDSGCAVGADVKCLLLDSQALRAYEHILTYKTPGNLMLLLTAPTDINCNGETDSGPQHSRPVFFFL